MGCNLNFCVGIVIGIIILYFFCQKRDYFVAWFPRKTMGDLRDQTKRDNSTTDRNIVENMTGYSGDDMDMEYLDNNLNYANEPEAAAMELECQSFNRFDLGNRYAGVNEVNSAATIHIPVGQHDRYGKFFVDSSENRNIDAHTVLGARDENDIKI